MKALRIEKQYDKSRWLTNRETESVRNRLYRISAANVIKQKDRERSAASRLNNPGVKRKYNIARKHGTKRATPAWADMAEINSIYREAKKMVVSDGIERHVDHVIPLRHPLVCGLHVHNNLEILTSVENMKKHNRFEVCDG